MSKPLVGEYLQFKKEPTNELDKNAVTWVRTNSHFKEEVVGHVQQNISMILSMFFLAGKRWRRIRTRNLREISFLCT